MLFGMLFGRAVLSMGMILLAANAVFNLGVGRLWQRFRREPVLWALTGIFFLYLLSGLYSEQVDYWVDRSRMKLPFLLLPFAILSIPRMEERVGWPILLGFSALIAGCCGYSLVLFALDYEAILEGYKQGQVLPTPIQHIRFSLMVVYGCCVCLVYLLERPIAYPRWVRWVALGGALFFMGYLHLLAVRSGLVALYGILGYFALHYLWQRRPSVPLMVGVVVAGMGLMYASYRFIPTIYNKVNYTFYSLDQMRQGVDVGNLSDSHRLGTIWAGWQIGLEHPLIGVGVGDIQEVTDQYLRRRFPSLAGSGYLPHNQYVLVFAATGIIGLLYFSIATLLPLWYRNAYRYPLIVAFHIIVLSSFLVEHTLETQLGTAFYLLFVLLHFRLFLAKTIEV